jgi:glutamyl-tRNA synthetase
VWCAIAARERARLHGGELVVRVEDIDPPRVVRGSVERILEDLDWLGLSWDGEVSYQSQRSDRYEQALAVLAERGMLYPCDCSRAEIARVASAPHAGEEVVYPGTCRDADPARPMKRPPALRLRVPADAVVDFVDEVEGPSSQRLSLDVGDFVLKRGDGVYAYQLAVSVDDGEMQITHVQRGADLLASTHRQIFLMRLLDLTPPAYAHLPLVVASDGARLAKRTRGATVRSLRAAGIHATEIVGRMREALALDARGVPTRREPWAIPEDWARAVVTSP